MFLVVVVFVVENVMVPVQGTDYIMDVVSMMERQGIKFSLCFRRVLWLQGLRLDNELLVSVIYYQVIKLEISYGISKEVYRKKT